jgi:hypothetical protein
MARRGLALGAMACGLALIVAAQRLAPIAGPPLYDGVVVEDAYKWLSPPPGYSGGAQGASASGDVQGSQSPNLGVGTSEQPPQAQVFAGQGFLVMPPGTTTIKVSIEPVQPAAQPSDGVIAGNVYRFSLTSQSGGAITGDPTGGVTVVLRGPANLSSATIERLSGTTWTQLQTDSAGSPNIFTAVVTQFGDFALVAPPGWVPASPGPVAPVQVGPAGPESTAQATPGGSPANSAGSGLLPLLIVGLGFGLSLVVAVGFLVWFRSRQPRPARPVPTRRPPTPPRSVRPRRPPPSRRRRQ